MEESLQASRGEGESPVPRRLRLAGAVAGAMVIGLLPFALFLGRLQGVILVAAAVGGVLIASWTLRDETTGATTEPHGGELVLGGAASLALTTVASLLAIGSYWLVFGALSGANAVAGWLELEGRLATGLWAGRISLGVLLLSGLGAARAATEQLVRRLHPSTAGFRSPYYVLLLERRRLVVLGVAAALVLIALFFVFPPPGRGFAVALIFFLFYFGISLENLGEPRRGRSGKKSALEAIEKLFRAAGYETISSPRTGRPEVDPLITNVDLLAISDERAWIVEVKAWGKGPVEWHEASRLRRSTDALAGELLTVSERTAPLMVLVGRDRAESLNRYLEDDPVSIAELAGRERVEEILAESDPDRLREQAVRHLGVEPASDAPRIAAGDRPPAPETAAAEGRLDG